MTFCQKHHPFEVDEEDFEEMDPSNDRNHSPDLDPSAEHWNPHHQVPVNLNLRSTVNPYLEQYLPNPARPDRNSINNKRTPGTYSCSRKHLHSSHNGYNGRRNNGNSDNQRDIHPRCRNRVLEVDPSFFLTHHFSR